MRIVCASCATRFTIDDTKVPERAFRVRCKRCDETIVVPARPATVGLFDTAPEPAVPMVASRNESSVLFSIANLHQLARSTVDTAGSGLIDIRPMARPQPVDVGREFVAPAAPVLIPSGARPRWMLPTVVGLGAALTLSLMALLLVLVLRQPPAVASASRTQPANQTPTQQEARLPAPPLAPLATAAPVVKQTSVSGAQKTERTVAVRSTPRPAPGRSPRQVRRPRSAAPEPRVRPPVAAPSAAPRDELTRLLDRATGAAPVRRLPVSAEEPSLPPLEKRDIEAGVRGIRGEIQRCFDRFRVPGEVRMKLTISPAGRMSQAEVHGRFDGTPTGSCLHQAFLGARFVRFRPPALTVWFPVILH